MPRFVREAFLLWGEIFETRVEIENIEDDGRSADGFRAATLRVGLESGSAAATTVRG